MRYRNGFSLVEVLVTLLILKVGLLGVLAAQTLALKQLQNAIQRTQAVLLANSIINDLQLNPALKTELMVPLNSASAMPVETPCNDITLCNTAQLAANQFADWLKQITNTDVSYLIAPQVCLVQGGAGADITVSWLQREAETEEEEGCEQIAGRSWLTVKSAG